ncbi:MAG: helix-turn-helix transcriptional regulator [Chroococcidiopsidaceae cyanobacterium CP_BM_ER_R8_30]|nr:helix-turn-helix transcriptional regulator [Chroococcidiopsidaceae cyanobacterium CP_BM_ER_R8_30]
MSDKLYISPEQCRAARAMLCWSQDELAGAANVSRSTVADFERGVRIPVPNNIAAIRSVFEQAGIEFLPEQGSKGAGVRFRPSQDQDK